MLRGLLPVSGIALGLATAQIAAAGGQSTADGYQTAHAFLRVLYPALHGQGLSVTISADRSEPFDSAPHPLRAFVVSIAQTLEEKAPGPLLTGRFEFAVDDTLFIYLAGGTYANNLRRQRLVQWAGDHRGASIAEVTAVLLELEAKFGPRESAAMRNEVLRQLRLIEPVLGRIDLQELVFHGEDAPTWQAEIVVATPHGRRRYGVLFEPFDGRLISMRGLGVE